MAKKKKAQAVLEAPAEIENTEAEVTECVDTPTISRKMIRLDNGSLYEVLSENGKYYVCDGGTFRKGNPHIRSVEEG